MQTTFNTQEDSVNRAFSKQSANYDAHDEDNLVLQDMRRQVYGHVERFLKPNSRILELNAGTGIDAVHFVSQGHRVHAIDISEGMIEQIRIKQQNLRLSDSLTCQHLSYARLDQTRGKKFDYVFSNFGGLNCIADLSSIAKGLPPLLEHGARLTLVIMPPVCPWEMMSVFKGNKNAFRRFRKGGVKAHVEGEFFQTYYHRFGNVQAAFGGSFKLLRLEALALLTPQPHQHKFPERHPIFYNSLRKVDEFFRNRFPFNQWGDHIIVTLEYM